MIGTPEFIITTDPKLGRFSVPSINNDSVSLQTLATTFSEWYRNTTGAYDSEDLAAAYKRKKPYELIVTSRDVKLLGLEHSFGEDFNDVILRMTLLDYNNFFEYVLLDSEVDKAYKLIKSSQKFYIAFGVGDDLRYWTNFLECRLAGIRRTQDSLSTNTLLLEFIPGFGIGDSFRKDINIEISDTFKASNRFQKSIDFFKYKATNGGWFSGIKYDKELFIYDKAVTRGSTTKKTEITSVKDSLLFNRSPRSATIDNPNYNYNLEISNDIFGDGGNINLGSADKYIFSNLGLLVFDLIRELLRNCYDTPNVILKFRGNPITDYLLEQEAKEEESNPSVPGLINLIERAVVGLNNSSLKSPQFYTNSIVPTGIDKDTQGILKVNFSILLIELQDYIKFLLSKIENYRNTNIDLRLFREYDSSILSVWESKGIIATRDSECIVLGDEDLILEDLYGISLEKRESDIGKLIKDMSNFDPNLYGSLLGIEKKFPHKIQPVISNLIKNNRFPIFKFNQRNGNVLSLEVEDNFAYFKALNSKISLLRNYTAVKTKFSDDMSVSQYMNTSIPGDIYFFDFKGDRRPGEGRILKNIKDSKLSELTTIFEGFINYAKTNKDLKLLENLKAGNLAELKGDFIKRFVSIYENRKLAVRDPNRGFTIQKIEQPGIVATKSGSVRDVGLVFYKEDFNSDDEIENTINLIFNTLFDRMFNDLGLLWYIEEEKQFNPLSLNFDVYKDVAEGAFKLTINTLPMYKLCNYSFIAAPCLFVYDEASMTLTKDEKYDFLTGLYKITGIKHTLNDSEMMSTIILRKVLWSNYEDS